MNKKIHLSEKTQQLLMQYETLGGTEHQSSNLMDQQSLIHWLQKENELSQIKNKKIKKEMEFLLISLRVELLRDLLISLNVKPAVIKEAEDKTPQSTYIKFYLLAIAGTIFAACEGFDSITTVLGVLNLPIIVPFLAGLFFASLSVMVFYGFDLVQVAKNLDIKLQDAPKLLDLHLQELDVIKKLRKKIDGLKLNNRSIHELEELAELVSMLEIRLRGLADSSKQFKDALDSPSILFAKNLFVGVAGLMFFGSGFFAGQSVAVFLLALLIASTTPASWPVLLFATAVGLASFALYWYVEKVGLQQLISSWFGLDEEKIEQLCDQNELEAQTEKLEQLKEKIESSSELIQEINLLKEKNKGEERPQCARYSFHRPAPVLQNHLEDKASQCDLGVEKQILSYC